MTAFASDEPMPITSSLNFTGREVRANNVLLRTTEDGTVTFSIYNGSGAPVHAIIDVTGYLE